MIKKMMAVVIVVSAVLSNITFTSNEVTAKASREVTSEANISLDETFEPTTVEKTTERIMYEDANFRLKKDTVLSYQYLYLHDGAGVPFNGDYGAIKKLQIISETGKPCLYVIYEPSIGLWYARIPNSQGVTIYPDDEPILVGDINSDGEVDDIDLSLLKGIIIEKDENVSFDTIARANFNRDTDINVADIVAMQQYILGM